MSSSKWDRDVNLKGPDVTNPVAEKWIGNPVEMATKRLSIEISSNLHYALKMLALQKNLKMKDLVTEALEKCVYKNKCK